MIDMDVAMDLEMALIIKNLIDLKFFSFKVLNNWLEMFDYDVTKIKNTPTKISATILTNGSIIMSASEMLCLVRYFGLHNRGFSAQEKRNLAFLNLLHKIIGICFSRYLQPECHIQLNKLVSEHNQLSSLGRI